MKYTNFTDDELILMKWSIVTRRRAIHEKLSARWHMQRVIAERTINEKLYVEQSGMDCDGVQYTGTVHEIEPTIKAFEQLHYDVGEWVDGPYDLYILTPKEYANHTGYHSRDLGMEAYEDGHPHCIHV